MSIAHHIDTGTPSRNSEGDEPTVPLLMLHGIGGWAESWRPQFDTLSAATRCVAWTMPGYAPSPPLHSTSIETLSDAALGLLDHLDIARADVIGHSMGGYIAQQLSLTHPERVGRLVLAGTTAAFGKPGSSFNDDFLGARLEPLDRGSTPGDLAADLVAGLVGSAADDEVRDSALASMSNISTDAYRAALHALVAWNATDRLGDLQTPTLCIAADADGTAPVRAMERLDGLLPNSSLVTIADSGHLMNLEQPEAFNRLVAEFLGLGGMAVG